MKKLVKGILIGLGVLVILGAVFGDDNSNKANTSTTNDVKVVEQNTDKKKTDKKKEKPNISIEKQNALTNAKFYGEEMHMSKADIYDQLTSEYGGKFNEEDAQYAVDNIKIDYNKNALAQAKQYQKDMHMSKADIKDQLTSEYGGKFTESEAEYAIQNLED